MNDLIGLIPLAIATAAAIWQWTVSRSLLRNYENLLNDAINRGLMIRVNDGWVFRDSKSTKTDK